MIFLNIIYSLCQKYSLFGQPLLLSFEVVIAVLIAFYLLYRWRISIVNRRKNELEKLIETRTYEINLQKEEILAQKEALTRQQEKISQVYEELTQSIHTAQRIQESYLPPDHLIKKYLPDFFALYLPKDIVSGDFYWMHVKYDKIFLAAVDCTGHGVAGAFMSIIGNNLLTQIVTDNPTYNAAEILNQLSVDLIRTLHQDKDNTSSREGMDLALCIVDTDENLIQYAGANNPLYIIRNNEIQQVKADNKGIGLQKGNKSNTFTNHIFEIQEGDAYYIFSDGYVSQFGGPGGNEKMKFERYRQILVEINHLPFAEQRENLLNKLKDWQGFVEQTDDILVLGFKGMKR